jgi:ribonuclease P protein subunit RPR2
MLRVARERISVLFALAGSEAAAGRLALSDRYITLARRIGTRYNVRLLPEYRELYCRGCSTYWVEGRTVRTRLRAGRRVRACLKCGRLRRVPLRFFPGPPDRPPDTSREGGYLADAAPVDSGAEVDDETSLDDPGAEEE